MLMRKKYGAGDFSGGGLGQVHIPYSMRSSTIRFAYALDGDLPRLADVKRLLELVELIVQLVRTWILPGITLGS